MRFLNFISALETKINLQELENCIGQAVVEDKFIQEICTPLISGGKRLRPLLFLACSCANKNFSPGGGAGTNSHGKLGTRRHFGQREKAARRRND